MLESNRVKLKLNEDVYKKKQQKKKKHVSKVFINLLDNSLQSS